MSFFLSNNTTRAKIIKKKYRYYGIYLLSGAVPHSLWQTSPMNRWTSPLKHPFPKSSHSPDVQIWQKKQAVSKRQLPLALRQSPAKHSTKAREFTSPSKSSVPTFHAPKEQFLPTTAHWKPLSNSKTSRRTNPQNIKKNISTSALINMFNSLRLYRTII